MCVCVCKSKRGGETGGRLRQGVFVIGSKSDRMQKSNRKEGKHNDLEFVMSQYFLKDFCWRSKQ